jgi:hypothetical protein
MTGTCPHRRVHGSSLHIISFHIATSTSGQRGEPWRRTLHQRWVTRLHSPSPRCVAGHPFPERRRRIANLSYRLGGGRQRAATISPLSSTKNRLERFPEGRRPMQSDLGRAHAPRPRDRCAAVPRLRRPHALRAPSRCAAASADLARVLVHVDSNMVHGWRPLRLLTAFCCVGHLATTSWRPAASSHLSATK